MNALDKHNTAILVFALTSQAECKRKKIDNCATLFSTLSEHSLNIVSRTKLPYLLFTEKEQHGDSFGERFTNAIQAVFDLGFEQVITIGNDTPQLKATHLLKAAENVKKDTLVLGPSADGGFYLMGLHRENFNREKFKDLPWQHSMLVSRLVTEFTLGNRQILQLERLFDIDTRWDLGILSKFSGQLTPRIGQIILALTNPEASVQTFEISLSNQYSSRIPQNKGSPLKAQSLM